jgi:cytochrome c biogenesis protein ResB
MAFRDSVFYRVYWWMTGLKLTIVLLSIILLTLIAGTIFEARNGNKAAQFLFYNSRWFDALLIFFGLNLICCTIRRFKRKLSQAGFITTHIGVMVILIGGLMSRNLKLEGQLIIPEGESRNYLLLDHNVLRASVEQDGKTIAREYDTHYDKTGGRTDVRDRFRLPEAGIVMVVDQYYPDFRTERVLADDGPEPNPALDLEVVDWSGETKESLFARGGEHRELKIGAASVNFVATSDAATLADELGKPGPVTTERLGVVEVGLAGGRRITIPVDGGLGRPTPIAGTEVVVTVEGFFPHFTVAEERYASRSANLANPAVVVDVAGPGGAHERHLLLVDHRDLNAVHREGAPITATTSYRFPGERPPAVQGRVKFVLGPGGELHYITGGEGFAERRGMATEGQPITYPEAGAQLQVARLIERARLTERVWNGGREERNPAIHVRFEPDGAVGGEAVEQWVTQGMPHPVTIGDRTVTVDYSWKRHDLGFAVALEDFREITYPGISMAQSFESDVVVTGPEEQFDRKISMNNPLKFQGYKIFQSSFQRGERETSIFSVANDPGVPVVYTGFLILILGFILIFFVKPYLVRASGARRDPSPEVPIQPPLGEAALGASASSLGGGNRNV